MDGVTKLDQRCVNPASAGHSQFLSMNTLRHSRAVE
jgi:hypothetical protein